MVGNASLIPAAMWDVTIDVATLTASVGKRPDERSGQSYAETYLMEVTRYFTPSVMEIEGVTRTAPGRIKVDYTIAHPFPAATDPDAPASATNRADLGITGIVMFPLDVTDETPITYFAETARPIIANTDAIATADGYYVPAGLVYGLDMQANCFPFRRLVNDARRESRIGVPLVNLGVGNFDPNFGWQRSNWGPSQTGWTGYGALHQGQVARNSVELNLPTDSTASISLPVMLIAKYLDPVGPGAGPADRSANRLPTSDADRTKFLYRMPQAAWDLERVEVRVDGEFAMLGNSELTLQVRATDWDIKAQESGQLHLRDESRANLVEDDESGWPEFAVSVPTLTTIRPTAQSLIAGVSVRDNDDTEIGGDVAPDSGGAEDPVFFRIELTDSFFADRISRAHVGLLRVRDVADGKSHDVSVNPWLAPLSTDAPAIACYQRFDIVVQGVHPVLEATPPTNPILSGTVPTFQVSVSTGLSALMIIDWNGDGDFVDPGEAILRPLTYFPLGSAPPAQWINTTLEAMPSTINIRWWLIDGGEATTTPVEYVLGPNRPPTTPTTGPSAPDYHMLESQNLNSPAVFRWSEYPKDLSDPEGDPISFAVRRVDTNEIVTSETLPMAMTALPITSPPDSLVPFELLLCDPLHPGAAGNAILKPWLRVFGEVPSGWSRELQDGAAQPEVGYLCLDADGNSYVMGTLGSPHDFGGGLLEPGSAYVASFTPSGSYRWSRSFAEPESTPRSCFMSGEVTPGGQLVLGTDTFEATDFGGGVTPALSVGVVSLDAVTGSYLWHRAWAVPGIITGTHLVRSTDGDLTLAGSLKNPGEYSFGGPTRTIGSSSSPFVLRLTSTGEYLWDYFATGGSTKTWGFDEDATGMLYLSGSHFGIVDYGGGPQTGNGVPWLLSLTSDGGFRWSKVLSDPPFGTGEFWGIAGSRISDGCLVSGRFSAPIDLGSGTPDAGFFWVRYGSAGDWLWERHDAGAVLDIDTLPDGDFVLAGHFSDEADLGFGPILSDHGTEDSYVVRYSDAGIPRWCSLWQGEGINLHSEIASHGDWIAFLALHDELIDLDPSVGQYFVEADGDSDIGASFLLNLQAETGQW